MRTEKEIKDKLGEVIHELDSIVTTHYPQKLHDVTVWTAQRQILEWVLHE